MKKDKIKNQQSPTIKFKGSTFPGRTQRMDKACELLISSLHAIYPTPKVEDIPEILSMITDVAGYVVNHFDYNEEDRIEIAGILHDRLLRVTAHDHPDRITTLNNIEKLK